MSQCKAQPTCMMKKNVILYFMYLINSIYNTWQYNYI